MPIIADIVIFSLSSTLFIVCHAETTLKICKLFLNLEPCNGFLEGRHSITYYTNHGAVDYESYITYITKISVKCPAKDGSIVTLIQKIYVRVLVTVRSDKHVSCQCGSMLARGVKRWPTTEPALTTHPSLALSIT